MSAMCGRLRLAGPGSPTICTLLLARNNTTPAPCPRDRSPNQCSVITPTRTWSGSCDADSFGAPSCSADAACDHSELSAALISPPAVQSGPLH